MRVNVEKTDEMTDPLIELIRDALKEMRELNRINKENNEKSEQIIERLQRNMIDYGLERKR